METKQTAIQQLIDDLVIILPDVHPGTFDKYLEAEKRQIKKDYVNGCLSKESQTAEDYYIQNYPKSTEE